MRDGIISEQMKSRLIKAGLPATYEELVALAADTGIPADILFNEEGWQQLPTYLSKANLLSDATEVAIWETAKNRTVNDALKMLADVAYGRVASLTLTIKDTAGNPIPDVTVRLDSAPTVGEDQITGTDGKIKLDTNAGSHTAYLVYPIGYSAETAEKTVQVTGNTTLTVADVSRKSTSTIFTLTKTKAFYIARFLSPIQIDVRGGGGSGCAISVNFDNSNSGEATAYGGKSGNINVQTNVDVAGKLIRVFPGSGGGPVTASRASYGKVRISSGKAGGTTTIIIGEQSITAAGGNGGTGKNTADYINSLNGADGSYLFNDSSLTRKGGDGGGATGEYGGNDESRSNGYAGSGGATDGRALGTAGGSSNDATDSGGSGGAIYNIQKYQTGNAASGKGGNGFVAFRKAV